MLLLRLYLPFSSLWFWPKFNPNWYQSFKKKVWMTLSVNLLSSLIGIKLLVNQRSSPSSKSFTVNLNSKLRTHGLITDSGTGKSLPVRRSEAVGACGSSADRHHGGHTKLFSVTSTLHMWKFNPPHWGLPSKWEYCLQFRFEETGV